MRLKDKIALITGGGEGLGQAIAQLFAQEGAKVVVNDINPKTGQPTTDAINDAGGQAAFVEGDVSKDTDARKMVGVTVQTFGGLDILVNNAGIEMLHPCTDISEADFDHITGVNYKSIYLVSKYAIPEMVKRDSGSIINTSSRFCS